LTRVLSIQSTAIAATLVLMASLTACSHSRHNPAASLKAAAEAREHEAAQARAVAAARSDDREQLESIPLPSKTVYMVIHTRQSWTNPFLIVGKSSVNLSMLYPNLGPASMPGDSILRPLAARRREMDVRLSDLPEAITALPENAWPFGRVVAVEEDPNAAPPDRLQVRRNVEATLQILNDLGVVAYDWPAAGAR